MKKLLCLMLVIGSMSVFSMSPRCAKAEIQKDDLGIVMGVLNKNGVKFSMHKRSYSAYSIVARANRASARYVDNSISNLVKSPMMRDLGIQFRKLNSERCKSIRMRKDLSEI